jgi:hypothetical protein
MERGTRLKSKAMAAITKKPEGAPKRGRKPNTDGVPGELVSLEGLNLVFGTRLKTSPYDPLLDQLVQAGPGKALRFGDVRAKASVYARAKKRGLRVSFAESAGALYVRFDGSSDADVRKSRRDHIVVALRLGPMSAIQIAKRLREAGDASVDAQLVEAILGQMLKASEVVKRDNDNTWAMKGRAIAA